MTYKITGGVVLVLTIFTNNSLVLNTRILKKKITIKKFKRRGEFESPGRYLCKDNI